MMNDLVWFCKQDKGSMLQTEKSHVLSSYHAMTKRLKK